MKTRDHTSPMCCKGRWKMSTEWSRLHCTKDHCSQCQGLSASVALACLRWHCKSKAFSARWMSTSNTSKKTTIEKRPWYCFYSAHTSLSRLWPTVWSRFRRVWSRPAGSATSLRWMSSGTTEGTSRRWSVRAEAPWGAKETAKGRSHAPRILPEKCMDMIVAKNQWKTGDSTRGQKIPAIMTINYILSDQEKHNSNRWYFKHAKRRRKERPAYRQDSNGSFRPKINERLLPKALCCFRGPSYNNKNTRRISRILLTSAVVAPPHLVSIRRWMKTWLSNSVEPCCNCICIIILLFLCNCLCVWLSISYP